LIDTVRGKINYLGRQNELTLSILLLFPPGSVYATEHRNVYHSKLLCVFYCSGCYEFFT